MPATCSLLVVDAGSVWFRRMHGAGTQTTATLSQGQVLVVPSFALYRVLPAVSPTAASCHVVEGMLLGLDPDAIFRSLGALSAGRFAIAAQPHRAAQLMRVLSANDAEAFAPPLASNIQPLVHAMNGPLLPQITPSGPVSSMPCVPNTSGLLKPPVRSTDRPRALVCGTGF
jgi:hypothetical protein